MHHKLLFLHNRSLLLIAYRLGLKNLCATFSTLVFQKLLELRLSIVFNLESLLLVALLNLIDKSLLAINLFDQFVL